MALSGLLVIVVATLYPLPNQAILSAATPLLCLVCGPQGGQDVVLNCLLFVPFAVGLRLFGWSWARVVMASALLSFGVESLQYFLIPGRDASLSDLVSNTTGGVLGATLAPLLPHAANPSPCSARSFLLAGCVVMLAIQGLSAWLLSPWTLPGELGSGWANVAPSLFPFFGEVRSVRLDGVPMPPFGVMPDSAAVRERLNQGAVTLELVLTTGVGGTDRRLIYKVQVGTGPPLLYLDQYDRDVYFSVPTRGLQFRLQPPTLRLRQGFPSDSGYRLHLAAGESQRRLWLRSSFGNRFFELSLSPSHLWITFMPFEFALGLETRVITVLWLAAMFLPLGFWAMRAQWGFLGWATVMLTLVLALALLPAISGYPPVHWSEWVAGGLGIAAGWATHRLARYLQTRCASPSSSAYSSS